MADKRDDCPVCEQDMRKEPNSYSKRCPLCGQGIRPKAKPKGGKIWSRMGLLLKI